VNDAKSLKIHVHLPSLIKYAIMIWKKIKKVIIPLILAKILIFGFLMFRGDFISISRDVNYGNNYQDGFNNDTITLEKQKFIRIVRNEDKRGISIKLRERKNAVPLMEKDGESDMPIVD